MSTTKIKMPLLPDKYYHIYNLGNNGEKLFLEKSDYNEFLVKYNRYLRECCNTLAFCLLPDHFHFLVKIREFPDQNLSKSVSSQFRIFFQQYAQYFNKNNDRKGSLFRKYYRRVMVETEEDLKRLVFYIHYNPQKHGYINAYQDYHYSSYRAFNSDKPSKINRAFVLAWFNNDLIEFNEYHSEIKDDWMIRHIILEE